MPSKNPLTSLALALAVLASIAMPAATQANALPKFVINGALTGKTHVPSLGFGKIKLENADIGNVECQNLSEGSVWNEKTEGTEKGLQLTEAYTTYNCTSAAKCKSKNYAGEPEEGIFASSEGPPTVESGPEGRRTNNTSLPWTGEAVEHEPGLIQVQTHKIKVWIVIPPSTGGASACVNEGQEWLLEGDLEPTAENGKKSGLTPSNIKLEGKGGRTNFLTSPDLPPVDELNVFYFISEPSLTVLGNKVQLVTLQG